MQPIQREKDSRISTSYNWFYKTNIRSVANFSCMEESRRLTFPLHVPLVTPLESGSFGAGGTGPENPLIVTTGLPPANASEVAIRSVRAPPWPDANPKRTVTGPMAWKTAIGKKPAWTVGREVWITGEIC